MTILQRLRDLFGGRTEVSGPAGTGSTTDPAEHRSDREVGRVQGLDTGYAGETGAERRASGPPD